MSEAFADEGISARPLGLTASASGAAVV